MSSDYSYIKIDGYETLNGVRVPFYLSHGWRDEQRHYLDWTDMREKEARQLTSPYGVLAYAIGNGDDFHCFDHARLPDGRIILDAALNSETGSFLQGAGYDVVWPEDAVNTAVGFMDTAMEWLYAGGTPIRHHQRGWNQDEAFWVREVAAFVGDPRLPERLKNRRIVRDPRKRVGWLIAGGYTLPFNPEIVRLENPAAIVLRFGDYESELIGWKADDNVFELALEYMKRYGWDKKSPDASTIKQGRT